MKTISVGEDRYKIKLNYTLIGNDLLVIIKGGEEHIGSASLKANGELCKNINVANHKDYIVSKQVANILNKKFSKTVLVSCGIHIENAKKYEIDMLIKNAIKAIKGVEL